MIRIDRDGRVEFDGKAEALISEFACGLSVLCDELGRSLVMSQLLAAYYSMLAEERHYGFDQALMMYKDDTQEALRLVEKYLNIPGDNMEEKYKNAMEGENDE